MCGIAAIFAYAPSAPGVDAGELIAIRDHMVARGPDGAGEWVDPQRRIGLGHRRLAIIDLSAAGAQPMLWPERKLAITFNGEIYNYRQLRAALELKGHTFHSTSDTEVLLHLYAEHGDAMVNELRGMYAFAIWDGARHGLFLARDPFGIKPLYLADDGKTIRAASQVKALLAGGQVAKTPDPAGHVGFFLWGHLPEPYTLFKTIRSLPAGTTLWVGADGARRQKTFCTVTQILSSGEAGRSKREGGRSEFPSSDLRAPISHLHVALCDSIAHHLVADVPVGVFLSSGRDSTTLAALAAEQGGTLRTVTLGFEEYRGTPNDEVPIAELVAQRYGAQHQTVWVRRQDYQEHVGQLFEAMDVPTTDGVNTYLVSLAAKRASLKVALSGLGGDELFGGYPSFSQVPFAARALRFLPPGNFLGSSLRIISAPMLKHLTSPKYAGFLEYGGSYSGAYLLRRGMFMPWELPDILDREIVRQGWAELQPLLRLDETLDGLRGPRAKVSALEMSWYMRNQLLRDSDWAGMAHSLEIRVPLVDPTLLRALAPALTGSTPPTKRDLADAPAQKLPDLVLNRRKTGFQIPIRQWFLNSVQPTGERGLRGWARHVHARFGGEEVCASRPTPRRCRSRRPAPGTLPPAVAPGAAAAAPARVLVLASDAFGGHGGIAKFNRDLLSALCGDAGVEKVVAIPRLIPEPPGALPKKLEYVSTGVGGKLRFALAVLRSSSFHPRPAIILCGHINLLPLAFLARRLLRPRAAGLRPPIVLVVHGIDAWQPTRSWLVNRLAGKIDAFIAVSEFTRQRFLSWAKAAATSFLLPNCVDLAHFTPGPKHPELLDRFGLRGRIVLLTVARLSAQERYKGVDEVLEVLPALLKEIPNLSYLIVGDGTDRARLEAKAAQLGLRERVVFAGWIRNEETAEHYRLADAFVMPGRGEGFGIVYLEALACGVPVVASQADASAEVVRDSGLATVADPSHPAAIKTAILTALRMKRGARPAGIEKFSQEKFNERCGEILGQISENWLPADGRRAGNPAPASARNILVFRIGQLGDTILALPAMWAIRQYFPDARLTLLCDRHPGKTYVLAADLLRGTGIFDRFESYVVETTATGKTLRPWRMLSLLPKLRRQNYDLMVYLAPSTRTPDQVKRDRRYFSVAGIKRFIGTKGFRERSVKLPGRPLAATPSEADLLLARLAADGIPVPEMDKGSLELKLGPAENAEVGSWLAERPGDGGRPWIGIGPGSKMPAKIWPEERFGLVVMGLIERHDIWPVVFGGEEDAALGERLLRTWGRGYNAAGALSVRGTAAALRRCALFLGNDTGTMHLAAAVRTPCVAVFSARIHPGAWHPYGVASRIFRSQIECEGCLLVECVERQNECLTRIAVGPVVSACEELLRLKPVAAPALKTS